jgi:hypothetical protein
MQLSSTLRALAKRARGRVKLMRRGARHRLKRLRGTVTQNKVAFLIPGFAKAGTSALDAYLRDHPQICMGDEKEIHFFNRPVRIRRGLPDYVPYHAYFSPTPESTLLGEASTSYLRPEVLTRIRDYNPEMKFIVLLRHPVDRTYSGWNMLRGWDDQLPSFSEMIRATASLRLRRLPQFGWMPRGGQSPTWTSARDRHYVDTLQELWEIFPRQQTLILKSETLRAQPQETLDQVFSFLGVPSLAGIEQKEVLVGSYQAPMSQDDRRYLLDLFEKDTDEVERVLGWDCSDWRK